MIKLTDKEKFELFMKLKFDKLAALRAHQHIIPAYVISCISAATVVLAVFISMQQVGQIVEFVFLIAVGSIIIHYYTKYKETRDGIRDMLTKDINKKIIDFYKDGVFRSEWLKELKLSEVKQSQPV